MPLGVLGRHPKVKKLRAAGSSLASSAEQPPLYLIEANGCCGVDAKRVRRPAQIDADTRVSALAPAQVEAPRLVADEHCAATARPFSVMQRLAFAGDRGQS